MTPTYSGIELFDQSMVFQRKIFSVNGHKGVCRDADGSEILCITNSAENPVTLPSFQNGIIKIKLADASQTGLLSLDWSLAVHISCPRKSGFCIVETYDPTNPASTKTFANAILQVPFDGSATTQLLKHGSNSATYDGQPRTSVSDDGSRFAYGTNGGGTVTDTWWAAMGAPTPPPPTTLTVVYGMGQLVNGVATVNTGLTTITQFFTQLLFKGHTNETLSSDFPTGGTVVVYSSNIKSGPGHDFYWQAIGQ